MFVISLLASQALAADWTTTGITGDRDWWQDGTVSVVPSRWTPRRSPRRLCSRWYQAW